MHTTAFRGLATVALISLGGMGAGCGPDSPECVEEVSPTRVVTVTAGVEWIAYYADCWENILGTVFCSDQYRVPVLVSAPPGAVTWKLTSPEGGLHEYGLAVAWTPAPEQIGQTHELRVRWDETNSCDTRLEVTELTVVAPTG